MPPRTRLRQRNYRKNFIRQWREHRGLSQDQLVGRVRDLLDGFSKSTLSRLENSKSPYTQDQLEAIAEALGLEPQDLLMREPDGDAWSLMDTLRAIPADDLEQVRRIIETFRKAS